jgi:peptidoglycan/xylan/chitin deacetylase (PgdA/CDA1 family)
VCIVTSIKRGVIAPALYYSGFPFRLMADAASSVIFNYHGVVSDSTPRINNRHLSISQFEKDLIFFSKRFDVVPLSEIFDRPDFVPSGKRARVAITFDDGFENNFNYAIPLLEKYNFPASIFVLSATVDDPEFVNWADLLDVIFAAKLCSKIDFLGLEFFRSDVGYYTKSLPHIALSDFIKDQGGARLEPLKKLADEFSRNANAVTSFREQVKLMNADQLFKCSRSNLIEIGSHSKNHFNIGRIPIDLAKTELEDSRLTLERALNKEVLSIAYPDGDYTDNVKAIAEEVGYRRQLAVDFRLPSDTADVRIRRRFSYSNSTTHASNMVRLGLNWQKFSF